MPTVMGRMVRQLVSGLVPRAFRPPLPRCVSSEVRSEADIRTAVGQLSVGLRPEALAPVVLGPLMRELVALNTPALFLNIVDDAMPVHVVLRPWEGGSIRMLGSSYLVELGSAAPEGIEAFTRAPHAHVTELYPTAPDHPLYVISIERQAEHVYAGTFPPYLTHITIVVNGVVVTHCERLLHERGAHVWRAA